MDSFDFVIIGGGAGCVLAARLSEDPGVPIAWNAFRAGTS